MKANELGLELNKKSQEVFEKLQGELKTQNEKDRFENATLEYDYNLQEGVIYSNMQDLLSACFGEEEDNVPEDLKRVFAKWVIAYNTIYYMNFYLNNDNSLMIAKNYLNSISCNFIVYSYEIDEKENKLIWKEV